MNATEYLEHLFASGDQGKPICRTTPTAISRSGSGIGFNRVVGRRSWKVIAELKKEDGRFHMEGGSWTNDISWVRGYDNVLGPMEKASSQFYEKVLKPDVSPSDPRFRNALFI
jgi:hypothetical protein